MNDGDTFSFELDGVALAHVHVKQASRNAERLGSVLAVVECYQYVLEEQKRWGDAMERQMRQREQARERLRDAGYDDTEIPL
jgi:hypothetical protein